MNKQIDKEIDKIFTTFNEEFFDGKLPKPLWNYNRCELGSINVNSVIKNNNEYQHELTLPINSLNLPPKIQFLHLAMIVFLVI